MSITAVTSLSHFQSLTSDPGKVSIIDFHATWCGPCKAIAPVYQRLASEYAGRVQFLKVDVDAARDVAASFSVSAMPTFVITRGGTKVDEMKGANPAGLMALVKKHAPSGSASAAPKEKGLEGFSSLNSSIDQAQIHCLNESSDHTLKHLIRGEGEKYLESDADEQLLLQIPFQQAVRLRAVRFSTASGSKDFAPKTVRFFVNQPTLDFDSADSPAQEVVLDEEQALGKKSVELRFVRFQNVNHLSVFVVDNQNSEDITRIDGLELIGVGIDGMRMDQLRAEEEE
ncbi:hypothetical protein JCM11251_001226 [Rhodosporidiobolus azoricus]